MFSLAKLRRFLQKNKIMQSIDSIETYTYRTSKDLVIEKEKIK